MKALINNDTIQIEITDACINKCSNCTRFLGHKSCFFMSFAQFKEAVDSLIEFPNMVGFQGGEPLLHPEFEKFCIYALSKIDRKRLGLWTTLPKGYEHYREIICQTFGNIFINDHSRPDIFHHPFLVGVQEVIPDKNKMFIQVNNCYFQDAWSASINPKGAWFCEIAGTLSLLLGGSDGWKVEKNWWMRTPKDYKEQIEEFCPSCGGALCLHRRPSTPDWGVDDISPINFDKIKNNSEKAKRGLFVMHDLKEIKNDDMEILAAYKDMNYRNRIAYRYGMFIMLNNNNFNEPFLLKKIYDQHRMLDELQEHYKGE